LAKNSLASSLVFMPPTKDLQKKYSFIPPVPPHSPKFQLPPDSLICLASEGPNLRANNDFNSPNNQYMKMRKMQKE